MEKEPFTIRAHHLIQTNTYFQEAIQDLSKLTCSIKTDIGFLISDLDEYTEDLLGTPPEEYLEEYHSKLMDYFSRFANLPDDYPVHITDQKDGICKACKIGKHCDEDEISADEATEHDYMKAFLEEAESVGLEENKDYTVISNISTNIIKIQTSKKAVVNILGQLNGKSQSKLSG